MGNPVPCISSEELEENESKSESGGHVLRLYIAGRTPRSRTVFANLKRICAEHLVGECAIEVIDLIDNPRLARTGQIVALPTLVRRSPLPMKRVIGDLSDTERVLAGLDIRSVCQN